MSLRFAPIAVLPLVIACSTDPDASTTPEESTLAVSLEKLSSCEQVAELIRESNRAQMNAALDATIQELKDSSDDGCVQYESNGAVDAGEVAPPPASTDGASTPSSVSETNNQVAGVDEADLIKTDGQYLYLAQGKELRIVDAWPAAEAALASRTTLSGTAKKLFVLDDRALVYVSVPRSGESTGDAYFSTSECTYGYGCDFSGDGTSTQVIVFDIADRTAPKVLRTIDLMGSLIAARRIGSAVHTVVSIGSFDVPELEYPSAWDYLCNDPFDLVTAFGEIEAMRERNNHLIDSTNFDVGTLAREGDRALGIENCTDFYRESVTTGTGITTVVSLDMLGNGAPTLANIVSRAGAVYASSGSLYMSVPHQRQNEYGWYSEVSSDEASTIHRFLIDADPQKTAYVASGIVPGHVLNQFSMDEHNGSLRIATTNGWVPSPEVSSNLLVLQQEKHALRVVGSITGIAPSEDIRSVRFQGDRGYVVTFKKTDPLFVLDLESPEAPKLVGELKIPGFSTYMHPLDETHLLALGYEADDRGEYAYFNGIQLQIFDVTNPTKPNLLHKLVYGTRGSSSSALTDHLGFTYLSDRGLLTLPMSICEGGGNGNYGSLSFSGVVALNVSVAEGITEIGRLEEPYPTNDDTFYYGAACSDWWTDSNSVVDRTVVLDNYLYAISENRVRVQNLGTLGTDVALIDFL